MKNKNLQSGVAKSYVTPQCDVFEIRLENTILSGDAFGSPGMPGSDLDVLDEFVF